MAAATCRWTVETSRSKASASSATLMAPPASRRASSTVALRSSVLARP